MIRKKETLSLKVSLIFRGMKKIIPKGKGDNHERT